MVNYWWVVCCSLLLTACSDGNKAMQNIEAFVTTIQKAPVPTIAPLPVFSMPHLPTLPLLERNPFWPMIDIETASAFDMPILQSLQTQYIRLNYSKAQDMANLIKANDTHLLSEQGSISLDQRTNTLIVQDIGPHLQPILDLIAKVDIPVPHVLIEARIVNIDTSFEQDLGIRWGLTSATHTSGTLNGANAMMKGSIPGAVPLDQRLNVNLGAELSSVNTTPSMGLALANLGHGIMLDLELSAIETENGGELISSPRVITANQHPAYIEQGQEIPYQQSTSSGATAVEFKKAVLSLKVTPQITPDDNIIMDIKVTQDSVDPLLTVHGVPAIDTREIETNIVVKNGDTIVLGGVYEENQRHKVARVPFLGSIPYAGFLFRNKDIQRSRRELLIFITPKIVSM